MPVAFKLSFHDVTRRVTFPERPNWNALSARINSLYALPLEDIGVCYTDVDGDLVTLNSEDELRDFYFSSPALRAGQDIKFRVVDLTSVRHPFDDSKPLPDTPRDSSSRNTFGGTVPLMYEVEDDWQYPLGGTLLGARPFPQEGSTHAFVETVDGSTDSSSDGSVSQDETSTNPANQHTAKGKERAQTRTFSSVSVIDNDSPPKPPVHVQVHPLRGVHSDTFGPPPAQSTPVGERSPPTFPTVQAESSPPSNPSVSKDSATSTGAPDPPTPVISPSPIPPSTPTASLSNDVAALLNSVSAIFSTHPELSENVRNILHNINNGAYWAAHRENVARVAEDIRRAAREVQSATTASIQDAHRAAEEEAGRRVTEALGNIVRMFGDISAGIGNNATSAPSESEQSAAQATGPGIPPPPRAPWAYGASDASAAPHGSANGQFPMPPPPIVTNWPGLSSFPPMPPPLDVRAPPPGVPMAGFAGAHPSGAMPFLSPMAPSLHGPTPGVSPMSASTQPTSIPAWSQFRPFTQPTQPVGTTPAQSQPALQSPQVSYYTASPVSPTASRSRLRAAELKASLEAAKENYKKEKERYRKEREERRRLRAQLEQRAGTNAPIPVPPKADLVEEVTTKLEGTHVHEELPRPSTPPPTGRIVSNARNGFPQLEIVSLPVSPRNQRSPRSPRRHNTVSNPVSARPVENKDVGSAQATQNVVERLGDMGFTQSAYPSITSMINARLPEGKMVSKAKEDDVVSEILDELLTTPASPRASGSGAANLDWD